jgi:hypothetical protein
MPIICTKLNNLSKFHFHNKVAKLCQIDLSSLHKGFQFVICFTILDEWLTLIYYHHHLYVNRFKNKPKVLGSSLQKIMVFQKVQLD